MDRDGKYLSSWTGKKHKWGLFFKCKVSRFQNSNLVSRQWNLHLRLQRKKAINIHSDSCFIHFSSRHMIEFLSDRRNFSIKKKSSSNWKGTWNLSFPKTLHTTLPSPFHTCGKNSTTPRGSWMRGLVNLPIMLWLFVSYKF